MVEPPWITEGRSAAQAEPLPPWSARNERDARQMVEWTNAMLDDDTNGRRPLSPEEWERFAERISNRP